MAQTYDFINASTLLRDGIYEVPDYQRNYAWVSQQLRDLWEDVSGILPNADHYTGTVIVKKLENLTKLGKAFSRFELIDGQQRLTTTVILLASICQELKKRASDDALQTARNVLTEYIYDAGTDTHKLKLNHGDDSYLKEVILKTDAQQMVAKDPASPSETKLRDARSYFASQLDDESEEQLQQLVNNVLNGLKFTRFQVDTDAEAGLIFEVTNNRGRPLNNLDKIKNYLMYISYKAGDSPLATAINESWAEVLRNIFNSPRLGEEEILRYHWVMRTGVAKEYDVHSRLKERLRPPFSDQHLNEIRDYVATFKEASYVIRELSNPEEGFKDWPAAEVERIVQHLSGLSRLRVFATFIPLVVASRVTLRSDPAMFRNIVAACEAFALRVYKIANRRADTGLTMFAYQARTMFSARGKTAGDIQAACKRVLDTIHGYVNAYGNDATVTTVLGQQDVTETLEVYEIRYLLSELERWKCDHAKEKALGWAELEKASLEHILPQYPEGCGDWSTDQWSQHLRIRNNFGNLTLTFWNSELSNKPFSEKRLKYVESNLRIQRELGNYSEWQEGEINGRRDELIDFVLHRWSVPTL
ncbi:MAG: DUF262 domain-containing protein [Chloroflexi bacterium]|nr:DUF262 domain-containing protein [Chloroflexota bacterium]